MSVADYLPLILFVSVSTITPGGATTLATASGARFGYYPSLPFILGIAAGLASMSAGAATGLGGLILAFPALQFSMKLAGSLYLLWLAWKLTRSGPPHLQSSLISPTGFAGALWLVWHNPKGWTMALGASASFASLTNEPLHLALLLGGAFGIAAILSLSFWCVAGLLISRFIRTDRQWLMLNVTLGLMLIISIIPVWLD